LNAELGDASDVLLQTTSRIANRAGDKRGTSPHREIWPERWS